MIKPTDEQMERIVGNLLRGGVMIAAFLVFLGGIFYLFSSGADLADYQAFKGEPAELRSVYGILTEVLSRRTSGVIQLGLLFLIATPIVRVAFSILAFALQRDRTYTIVTLVVFAILIYSLTVGRI